MEAEKFRKIVHSYRIVMPDDDAYRTLSDMFGVSENTVKGYLNVSNNRTAEKAIDVQVAAINICGGQLVDNKTYEWTLLVHDDDQTIAYELN